MPLKDQIKNFARKAIESRPDGKALRASIRPRKPIALLFDDDGIVPNNPRLPLIIYRGAVDLSEKAFEPGAIIDALFESNGWGRSWRDTIYDFVHYHSQIHETMGVAQGWAEVEFGGVKGRRMRLKAGDVAILPAGTGHRLIEASRGFLVVGAYPADGTYDECTDTRKRVEASKRVAKTPKPKGDPVYGSGGPLKAIWAGKKKR
jgi:uncharacterized protein YjlB